VDDGNNNGESVVPTKEVAAVRAKKTADATAAAAAAAASIVADAKGPHSQLHSSVQVLLLNDSELWDTIVVNWCKPDAEMIVDIVETWEGRDLAACVWKLGLPVLYATPSTCVAPSWRQYVSTLASIRICSNSLDRSRSRKGNARRCHRRVRLPQFPGRRHRNTGGAVLRALRCPLAPFQQPRKPS
jgi:hypothetical protein